MVGDRDYDTVACYREKENMCCLCVNTGDRLALCVQREQRRDYGGFCERRYDRGGRNSG